MSDILSVIVDGLWRQGNKSLAVRLVAENGKGWFDELKTRIQKLF